MIVVKKFVAAVIVSLMILTTPALAHKWEWAAYSSSSPTGTVYIDSESVINIENLFTVGDVCIQAMFKAPDGTIFLTNFLRQGANFYFFAEPVSANALKFFNLPSTAQREQSRFDELMARGVRASQAHRLVDADRPKIQDEYKQQLIEGIMSYGTNPNGSLNLVGMSLLYKMATVDLQRAGFLARSFAFAPAYELMPQGGLASKLYSAAVDKLARSYQQFARTDKAH